MNREVLFYLQSPTIQAGLIAYACQAAPSMAIASPAVARYCWGLGLR